ncbi:MinD/ParA family protein [Paenibacillus mucilaginosus]|uniref:Cobyrinic acid ac-diamide synthase n=3 Tax=Paenibacillus mucilaginosus TaxID=61624 RepID=H6NQ36_9BACL|nr:MinD/ParA family protein [Paenibacillus mucilaginosus]AEI44322.1 Cobyrinic acid ac-diamide synthase [Paenibacillus mucilaginosus KNP414]AFC31860.1 Cobyrinic acid ac-diamide synthase [Paenibacillus mucilaginosus 3016]AFH64217.1 cobyrinic acid a,c-diamide synthase [Paenibacillus mucilaginosus K02]MCG7217624.1 MinD/ParA family protein [Paenibacillus mucilaginosus]WDM25718.1 MinD/ParA family protein [Paenibacillus mucilaginosus]
MNDQAQGLRNLIKTQETANDRATRIITVTSGKGGVGKSNFTLNFALALQKKGLKVLVFDADIGLANIDVLMGVSPKYSLYHLLKREKTIWEIIHTGYNDLQFIAGGSGFNDLIRLSDEQLDYFAAQVEQLNGHVDVIIFDTGAGLSKETLKFIVAAQETIVVTTPEPTSITDAYAIIKMVNSMNYQIPFKLVVNRVTDWREGRQTADKISMVAKQFLSLDIPTLGYVVDDSSVSKAVKKQVPFTVAFPDSAASKSINDLADDFIAGHIPAQQERGAIKGFLSKMMKMLKQ